MLTNRPPHWNIVENRSNGHEVKSCEWCSKLTPIRRGNEIMCLCMLVNCKVHRMKNINRERRKEKREREKKGEKEEGVWEGGDEVKIKCGTLYNNITLPCCGVPASYNPCVCAAFPELLLWYVDGVYFCVSNMTHLQAHSYPSCKIWPKRKKEWRKSVKIF